MFNRLVGSFTSATRSIGITARPFSTTTPTQKLYAHVTRRKLPKSATTLLVEGDPVYMLPREVPEFPPYPYGDSPVYKQSNRGLYGGKMIQFGHKISEFKNRNVRTFKPNVNRQTLWSETLNQRITIKVVASVLRAIDREGGLDNYLIKDTSARIKQLGPTGWKLRYLVLSEMERKQFTKSERRARKAAKAQQQPNEESNASASV